MKKILALVTSLTIISGVCAAVLAAVNSITAKPIADMKVRQEQAAVKAVMPAGVVSVERVGNAYQGKNGKGDVIGYAAKGADAQGYGGEIVLMVGFQPDKKTIVCYKTLVAAETPGLGMKLNSPEFAGQFAGKDGRTLKLRKSGGEIDAITSATITSKAVCRAISAAQRALQGAERP